MTAERTELTTSRNNFEYLHGLYDRYFPEVGIGQYGVDGITLPRANLNTMVFLWFEGKCAMRKGCSCMDAAVHRERTGTRFKVRYDVHITDKNEVEDIGGRHLTEDRWLEESEIPDVSEIIQYIEDSLP